jgi:hypothetical protein
MKRVAAVSAEGWWPYWMAVGPFLLVVAHIVLVQDNRPIQAQVNQRQQFINQSVELGRINEALIYALAGGDRVRSGKGSR